MHEKEGRTLEQYPMNKREKENIAEVYEVAHDVQSMRSKLLQQVIEHLNDVDFSRMKPEFLNDVFAIDKVTKEQVTSLVIKMAHTVQEHRKMLITKQQNNHDQCSSKGKFNSSAMDEENQVENVKHAQSSVRHRNQEYASSGQEKRQSWSGGNDERKENEIKRKKSFYENKLSVTLQADVGSKLTQF